MYSGSTPLLVCTVTSFSSICVFQLLRTISTLLTKRLLFVLSISKKQKVIRSAELCETNFFLEIIDEIYRFVNILVSILYFTFSVPTGE